MVGENNVEYIHLKGFSRGFNLREGHNQVWFVEALQNISKFIVEVLDSSDGMDPMSVCLVTDGDPMPLIKISGKLDNPSIGLDATGLIKSITSGSVEDIGGTLKESVGGLIKGLGF